MSKKNRVKMTPIQIQMLVDILYENSEIASGKFTPTYSREERNKKWEAIATLLNAKGLGSEKTPDQWKKSWSDLKFTIRSKASKLELAGGTDLMNEKLTNLEKRVLQLSGDVIVQSSEQNESKLTGKLLMEKIEEDLAKTEYDLAKVLKKRNQIALPSTVAKIFQLPEGACIKMPIVENVSALKEKDEVDDDSCVEISNDEPAVANGDDPIDLDDDGNDEDDDIVYDDSDDNEETYDYSVKDAISPPSKRRKVSPVEKISHETMSATSVKSSSSQPKSFISVFQKQLETQTAALKEQTGIMKDIAKSLRLIARSLHNS